MQIMCQICYWNPGERIQKTYPKMLTVSPSMGKRKCVYGSSVGAVRTKGQNSIQFRNQSHGFTHMKLKHENFGAFESMFDIIG